MSQFKPDELILKNGKSYPVVGGRLRVAHEDNESFSIVTELKEYEHLSHATVRATITVQKGIFSAYGCSSSSKDQRLADSLLELAETRAIARALRFAGYGVEYTGIEEIPNVNVKAATIQNQKPVFDPHSEIDDDVLRATRPQIHAIEKISTIKRWNAVECCKRILQNPTVSSLAELSKDDASEVIGRMKDVA